MSNMFSQNISGLESGAMQKKMTRRSTRKVEGTILSRHKNIVAVV
jgi:hypothetical protein